MNKTSISDAQLKDELIKLFESVSVSTYHLFINPRPRQYYIYSLYDEGEIFYIGKGKGKRAWCHTKLTGRNKEKEEKIIEILKKGRQPRVLILADYLNEYEALNQEAILISHFYHQLTNITHTKEVDALTMLQKKYGKENVFVDEGEVVSSSEGVVVGNLKDAIIEAKEVIKYGYKIGNLYNYKGKCYCYDSILHLCKTG